MTPLDALYRMRRAWEATQPQLFMELWPDDGLDDTHGPLTTGNLSPSERKALAVGVVEPAVAVASPEAGGLAAGAEPCCGTPSGLTAQSLHSPARIVLGGSAPFSYEHAPVADPGQVQRDRGEEVTL